MKMEWPDYVLLAASLVSFLATAALAVVAVHFIVKFW